jgi:hypothetical protein
LSVVSERYGALSRKTADALSVEGWRRGIAHRGAGRVRGASGLSPCAVRIEPCAVKIEPDCLGGAEPAV